MDSPELLLADQERRARHHAHVTGRAPGGSLRSLKVKLLSSCNLRREMCQYWRVGTGYERFRAGIRARRPEMCNRCDQFLPENRARNDALGLAQGPPPTRHPPPLITQVSA